MKTFVNALAWVVRRAPWAVIIITLVVALVLGGLGGQFTPSEDMNESFAPDAPELVASETISDRFGAETSQSVMQVIVSSEGGAASPRSTLLRYEGSTPIRSASACALSISRSRVSSTIARMA